jgi:hypothetical protein
VNQAALTVVVPIEESELGSLRTLLASIDGQVRARLIHASNGALFPFGDLTTVHFARFAVLDPLAPEAQDAKAAGQSLLLFATVHDGPRAQHLNELVTVAGKGLLRVFSLCDKSLQDQPRDRLREFFAKHVVPTDTFWVGHPGRSVRQIHDESHLHAELGWVLGRSSGRLASDPFAQALDTVRERADLRWALSPPDPTGLVGYWKALLWGAALALLPVLIAALPVAVPWLRALEWRDARNAGKEDKEDSVSERNAERGHKLSLLLDEGFHGQNQLTTLTDVKPGRLRLVTLYVVLRVLEFLGRVVWDNGALHGIRTIHSACWFLVNQGGKHRLVFLSNYDGSWENYLGQFIDRAASGLTAVWSNTVGFPEAKWLIGAGARTELKFKRWVRRHQIKTQVWYGAYPDLSVANVQNNSEIRRGLQGLRGLDERRAWLRRL